MTYDTVKARMGRRPITMVEIDLPRCTRTYGTAPCTAAVGTTGTKKCFNTLWTCQDVDNYAETTLTLRFATERIDDLQAAGELPIFPALKSVSFTPTRLDPGRSLGIRSSVSITLQDFAWGDVGTDPYVGDRSYDPVRQGTFFGKLLARQQYLENRPLRIYTGFLEEDGSYDVANFVMREYVTDRWDGPSSGGMVSVRAKDILRATDKMKSVVPEPSLGKLLSDINDSTTTIPLNDGQAADYGVDDYVRVGEEVMLVTAVDLIDDELTVDRATLPAIYPASVMVADEHKAGDLVQKCAWFDAVRIDELTRQLVEDWAGIDGAYIPFSDWEDEADEWFTTYAMSALITEPTGVDTLLGELAQHNVLLWWDERDQEVKFKALQPFPEKGAPVFNDSDNIIADSVSVSKLTGKRISQVWLHYGQRNPVPALTESSNYSVTQILADLDAETASQYGERLIQQVHSRWLHNDDEAIAIELVGRLLIEYRDTKSMIQIDIDAKDDSRWTGDIVMLRTVYFQDDEGDDSPVPFRIIEASENGGARNIPTKHTLIMHQMRTKGLCALVAPDSSPDYLAATVEERLYGFVGSDLARMSNGDNCYYIC